MQITLERQSKTIALSFNTDNSIAYDELYLAVQDKMSAIVNGGKFFVGKAFTIVGNAVSVLSKNIYVQGLTVAAAGGLGSRLAGGSFELGFLTAGLAFAVNQVVTQLAQEAAIDRAKAKLTNQPLSESKLTKANPSVGQGCGAYQCRTGGKHGGVDILAVDGTSIQAPGSGTASVGYIKGYGKTVLIDHGDGVQTRFAHLASYSVEGGATVSLTTNIGTVGRTGNVPSVGQSHLHFEVLVDGNRINPSDIFTWQQDE